MTITGWIIFIVFTAIIVLSAIISINTGEFKKVGAAVSIITRILLIAGLFIGMKWYYSNTASGIRALTDQKAEFANGLDRIINIYAANGNIIASYEGKIDLEDNNGGYVLFDFEGKRYVYYNCFVESIAKID